MHKSLIGLAKRFAPSFRKHPDRQSRPAASEALVDFKIVRIEFLETNALNENLGSYVHNI